MKEKIKSGFSTCVGHLAACMEPLMPILIAGSLTKIICILIGFISQAGTTKEIITVIGDVPFYFLPVFVALTASEHFKVDKLYAVAAALFLLMPSLVTLFETVDGVKLFGIPVLEASYSYSILPVIFLMWITSKIQPLLKKLLPKILHDTVYPLAMLVIMAVLGILVIGPLASLISNSLVSAVKWLTENAGIIAWPVFAGTCIFFIMTGTGLLLDAIAITQLGTVGVDAGIMAGFFLLNMALAGSAIAYALRRKGTDLAAKAWGNAVTALVVGVAEPTVFGLCLQEKKVLRNVVIASTLAGIFQGIVGIYTYIFSFPGLCAILMFHSSERPMNLVFLFIASVIAFVISFLLTFFSYPSQSK